MSTGMINHRSTPRVYVRWRQNEDVGVQFRVEGEEFSQPLAASGELGQRVERLEKELSELRDDDHCGPHWTRSGDDDEPLYPPLGQRAHRRSGSAG